MRIRLSQTWLLLIAFLIFILAISACGGGGSDSTPAPTPTNSIGSSGGEVTSSDGKVVVSVPQGALSQQTEITVNEATNPPSGNIGVAYEFGPSGTTFSQPVTISITYNETSIPQGVNEADLRLGDVVNNQWEEVTDSSVDVVANVVTGTTTHFSVYGVVVADNVSSFDLTVIRAGEGSGTVSSSPAGINCGTDCSESYNSNTVVTLTATPVTGSTFSGWSGDADCSDGQVTMDASKSCTATFNIQAPNQFTLTINKIGTGSGTVTSSPAGISCGTDCTETYTSNTSVTLTATPDAGSTFAGWSGGGCTGTGACMVTMTANTTITATFLPGTWTTTGNMTIARVFSIATLLPNGKVLVAGGCTADPCTTVLTSAEVYDPTSGTWTATGSMTTARNDHAAMLLPNGKVLVAGGRDLNGNLTASAELYDPSTGTWTTTGNMVNANNDQTATLLPNGKVLVTGGCCDSFGNLFASAELYDPATGTWTATGNMDAGRVGHSATLLPNGKVLVAGGCSTSNCIPSLASAELYDPATGAWTLTGSMVAARNSHSATLLPNGKLLVAGGNDINDIPISSAELYDPATGTWTTTGSMATARMAPSGVLLPNGKVLVAGGCTNANPCTNIIASAELYDPATGAWIATANMSQARVIPTYILLPNGKGLVAGGLGSGSVALASAELYTPLMEGTPDTWVTTGSMSTARNAHTLTLLPNGEVLVAGGADSSDNNIASAELYDPTTGTWTTTGSMAITRGDHTATLLPNGKVLVAGGDFLTGTSAELYDPATGTWTTTSSMAAARTGGDHSATLLPSGKVLVAGGDDYTLDLDFTSAELYDPATGTWSATGNMATARSHLAATLLLNGKVLVTGGDKTFSPVTPAELYDPAAGTWTAAGIMATARRLHTATILPNGKVLVAGGNDINDNPIASTELYDPATGTWTATGSMATARFRHAASLLPNGKVLVAGGKGTGNVFASAELYDPSTGTWAATGSMNTGRFFFNASGENLSAILPNGQILIAGGWAGVCCSATVLASAELYSTSIATSGGGSSKAFIGSSDGQMASQDNGHSSGFGCGTITPHDGSGPGDPGQAAGLLFCLSLLLIMRLRRFIQKACFHIKEGLL